MESTHRLKRVHAQEIMECTHRLKRIDAQEKI